jgi:hypothetical protein
MVHCPAAAAHTHTPCSRLLKFILPHHPRVRRSGSRERYDRPPPSRDYGRYDDRGHGGGGRGRDYDDRRGGRDYYGGRDRDYDDRRGGRDSYDDRRGGDRYGARRY